MEKQVKVNVVHRHDTETNWQQADMVPLAGEMIIYDVGGNVTQRPRVKLGDGTTGVNNLPFINREILAGTSAPTSSQGFEGDVYIKYE